MKLIVTVDQRTDYGHSTPIAVWLEGADNYLHKSSTGEWSAGDAQAGLLINEFTSEEFFNEYGLEPPATGQRQTLIASYSWEG